MIEAIIEFFLTIVVEILLRGLFYMTARMLVPLLIAGRIRVEPAPEGVKVSPRWHGFNRDSTGRIMLHIDTATLLGLIFWGVVAVVICVTISFR